MPPPPLTRSNWQELCHWLVRRRRRYQVVEQSMLPTLHPGDTVLAEPYRRGQSVLTTGDVVIVRHPSRPDLLLIKRVKETFDDGSCTVISDNLAEPTAQDSRSFGAIVAEQIIARVTSLLVLVPRG